MIERHRLSLEGEKHFALNVPDLAHELHIQLQRYIEAQYPIRHLSLVEERRTFLETSGVISQTPFIESMPGYIAGSTYNELALPDYLKEALTALSSPSHVIIPSRLYKHQEAALQTFLKDGQDLIVVTGTGSGKTETFLLPILARTLEEAHMRPDSFSKPGMRTLLLYPMNALVNDQLTRLRTLFGNPKLDTWLGQQYHVQRSFRFGMYTSRTPYPGILSREKNEQQLIPLLDYYLQIENEQEETAQKLKQRGRWPALDLVALRNAALEGRTWIGNRDSELFTRQQMQQWCPDILVTNYSMLEYMLMRPIEHSIFDQTAAWLAQDEANTLLIVLDEAHLYNGVTGAEISLLLKRLQARLNIDRSRVRYILTSASLDTGESGRDAIIHFGETLAGKRPQSHFAIIEGQRVKAPQHSANVLQQERSEHVEVTALNNFDLQAFANREIDEEAGRAAVTSLAQLLHWSLPSSAEKLSFYLAHNLPQLQAFQTLWEATSGHALDFGQLAHRLFPNVSARDKATNTLLALSAAARVKDGSDVRTLLPVRAHLFFRGLPPLYACINPFCSEKQNKSELSELGALCLSSRLHCTCGARVYELYSHRNCGAVFLRAFASNEDADFYWHEPGDRHVSSSREGQENAETLLLVGKPHPNSLKNLEKVALDISTGRAMLQKNVTIDTEFEGESLIVYRPVRSTRKPGGGPRSTKQQVIHDEQQAYDKPHWKSCPVCLKRLYPSSLSSLSTKGEQPFVNLVRRQFELQPPVTPISDASPNMGRKVLLFSDGRQRAARLARDLPREVELDTFRQALLLAVFQRSQRKNETLIRMDNNLYQDFVAVCAQYRLHFFDGESQKALLRHIADFRNDYDSDIDFVEEAEWDPSIPQGYRLALPRQVADRFYSMQRMCAAVVEPLPTSIRILSKKPLFARLSENNLRNLVINWIEALLDVSAFDSEIMPNDRENTVPGGGFILEPTEKDYRWNEAEEAAKTLFGFKDEQLPLLRKMFVDEFCVTKAERAFLRPEKLALKLTLDDKWYQCDDCMQVVFLPLGGKCPNPRCESTHLTHLPNDDPSLRVRTDFYREPIRQVIAGTRSPVHMTAEEHTAQLSYRDAQQTWTTTEKYELRFQDINISAEEPAVDVLSCTTTMEVGIDIGSLSGIGMRTMPPRRANYQQRAGRAGRRGTAISTVLAYSENGSHDAHYFAHPDEMITGILPCPQISRLNERLIKRHIQAALIQTFFLEYLQTSGYKTHQQHGYLEEALGKAKAFFTSSETYGLNGFQRWVERMLEDDEPLLARHVTAWLPDTLSGKVINKQQKLDFVREVAREFIRNLQEVGKQLFPQKDETRTQKSIREQKEQFDTETEETTLLDVLFEHGFLPSYAFPREVRSFVIEERKSRAGNTRIGIKERPQQSVDVALSEYAPGRELIVDKATYRVGGIYVDPFPGTTVDNRVSSIFKHIQTSFALCFYCGYTHQETLSNETAASSIQSNSCPLCHHTLVVKEILDPPGFAPEKAKSLQQSQMRNDSTGQNGITTQVQLVRPLTDTSIFAHTLANGQVLWNYAEHQELLIVNGGVQGDGFSVCRSCGAASLGDAPWLHSGHDRPFLLPSWVPAAQKCHGSDGIWQGFLGHRFHSDLLLMRFLWPDGVNYQIGHPWMRDALNTLAQALLQAATLQLDVATTELQVGWSYTITESKTGASSLSSSRMVDFFLYDTLSGGAGYATQVGQHIDTLLTRTQQILDNCPEQCERSCYRCLRTYSNRILHHSLDRRLAGVLLRAIVNGKPPETATIAQQATQLEMLCQFLELSGNVRCQQEGMLRGVSVPLLVQTGRGMYAVGSYPVQQDYQEVGHPLDSLPSNQVHLFSDYELTHNLPGIAQRFL